MEPRCVSAFIQFVLTTHNDQGDPITEAITQPVKLFRAAHADLWHYIDGKITAKELATVDAEDTHG